MLFKEGITIAAVFVTITFFVPIKSSLEIEENSHRSRRQLLFPNSTLLQCNLGVSTPTPVKTIRVNWAIQCNFQLPWNRSQIPVDIFGANSGYVGFSRKKRDLDEYYKSDAKLFHFYKYVEDMLNGFGHNGKSCVLRTLCELGSDPLHATSEEDLLHEIATYVLKFGHNGKSCVLRTLCELGSDPLHATSEEDLLHEIATYVLNPLNDIEDGESIESIPYIEAYEAGRELKDCFHIYDNCSLSVIDLFSKLH